MTIIEQLKRDEGCKLKPYRCTAGKLTIGIGRNLEDNGITIEEAEYLLLNDIHRARTQVGREVPAFADLDEARQGVLVNMCFNLGIGGVLKFRKMLDAIEQRNWIEAAKEMMDSQWAHEVGERANRLSTQMMYGEWQ